MQHHNHQFGLSWVKGYIAQRQTGPVKLMLMQRRSPRFRKGLGMFLRGLCSLAGGWRNGLRFDPLVKYGNWSYVDFFLFPLADALNAALQPDTKVYFGMQVRLCSASCWLPALWPCWVVDSSHQVAVHAPSIIAY